MDILDLQDISQYIHPMRATQVTKELSSFKLNRKMKKRLAAFARRKRVTMTAVLEALIDQYCLTYKEEK